MRSPFSTYAGADIQRKQRQLRVHMPKRHRDRIHVRMLIADVDAVATLPDFVGRVATHEALKARRESSSSVCLADMN